MFELHKTVVTFFNGLMTSRTDANGMMTFSHDSDGRLVFAYSDDGGYFEFAEYRYDALGRRISKEEPYDLPWSFTYDGDNMLVKTWGNAPTIFQNGPGIDNPLSLKIPGSKNLTYPLADHLGTATATDSFGNGGNGFTGRENDTFTGLMYYRARMYDPQRGRFISEDPIGFGGGDVNLYGYVRNNPQNLIDPTGLQPGLQFGPRGSFGERSYQEIAEDFQSMKNNCECRKSFEGFGIDLDHLERNGIFIGSGNTLSNPRYTSSDFGLTDQERQAALGHLNARAFTMVGGQDPRPHIFFNHGARTNMYSPFSNQRGNVRGAFAHELVHAGGIPGRPPSWLAAKLLFQDDLSYLNGWWNKPYSQLLRNCSQ